MFDFTEEELKNLHAIYTASEIAQQPTTWLKTLKILESHHDEIKDFISQVLNQEDFDIILTGAGTSEFVGNSLFPYLNQLSGYKCKSYGTTDIVQAPQSYLSSNKPTLLISFGRSGNSPESIGAVDIANTVNENVKHICITCNKEGKLANIQQDSHKYYVLNLPDETHDQSFAMTSSFTNMYLACLLCFEYNSQMLKNITTLISSCQKLIDHDFMIAKKIVDEFDFHRIVYLGAECLKGVAQESALKMLELTAGNVCVTHDTPLGFRHGPKSVIDDTTLIVMYVSDDDYTYQYELDLIKEMSMQRKGNKILVVCNKNRDELKAYVDYYYTFKNDNIKSIYLGFGYIIVAQLLALYKSLRYGITPDNPCPSGEVNRVVKGVTLYKYEKRGA